MAPSLYWSILCKVTSEYIKMAENYFCLSFIPFSYLPPFLLSTLWLSYPFPIQRHSRSLFSSFSITLYRTLTFFPFRTFISFLPYSILIPVICPIVIPHPVICKENIFPYPNNGVLDSVRAPRVSTPGPHFKIMYALYSLHSNKTRDPSTWTLRMTLKENRLEKEGRRLERTTLHSDAWVVS